MQQNGTDSIPVMEPSGSSDYIRLNRRSVLPSLGRSRGAMLLAAVSAVGFLLSPAIAAPAGKKKAPPVALSFDPLSTFTPAGADPKLSAAFGNKGLSLTDFKFTPAAAKSRPSQVRVAIRSRQDAPALAKADTGSASPLTVLTPASYNLGVAVGWRRFAVSGDVAKSESRNPALGTKESAVVGSATRSRASRAESPLAPSVITIVRRPLPTSRTTRSMSAPRMT